MHSSEAANERKTHFLFVPRVVLVAPVPINMQSPLSPSLAQGIFSLVDYSL